MKNKKIKHVKMAATTVRIETRNGCIGGGFPFNCVLGGYLKAFIDDSGIVTMLNGEFIHISKLS